MHFGFQLIVFFLTQGFAFPKATTQNCDDSWRACTSPGYRSHGGQGNAGDSRPRASSMRRRGQGLEAWKLLRGPSTCDMVFVELELTGESGLTFIEQAARRPVFPAVADHRLHEQRESSRGEARPHDACGDFSLSRTSTSRSSARSRRRWRHRGKIASRGQKEFSESAGMSTHDLKLARQEFAGENRTRSRGSVVALRSR